MTTAVMTRRAFDIRRPCRPGHSYVLRHAATPSPDPPPATGENGIPMSWDTPFRCPEAGHHLHRHCDLSGHGNDPGPTSGFGVVSFAGRARSCGCGSGRVLGGLVVQARVECELAE